MSNPAIALDRAPTRGFAANHSWDRNFYLVMAGLAWFGILRGFGGDIAARAARHAPAFPIIVHVHAAVFVLWLALFTVQILLIRSRKLSLHMTLGFAMVGLIGLMAIIGPATALTMQHRAIGDPKADPAFLSIQFTDIVAFLGLTLSAIWLRKSTAIHKRLILLGTLYITDAGFARWLADRILGGLGMSYWHFWIALYVGPVVLIFLAGTYDLLTRRKLHPAFLAGAAYAFALQMLAVSLYFSPAWLGLSKRVIAAWPW